ncbi:MAG: hypothetical protein NZ922_04560 [Candidatus Methanomethyliaceae archaeon]|nr:hypothetical protein [Candidatus Methanomethyliaceae archaeon]MDW7971099.1 hypothetical protein [Nitrososphaerota archaeon]
MIRKKHIPIITFTALAIVLIGIGSYYYYIYFGIPRCPVCGMMITPEMMENFIILNLKTNQRIYVCCPGCALRLVAVYPDLRIEMLDSWYGKAAPSIKIEIRNGTVASVMPESTRILLGGRITGSCAHNRIAINETSVKLLLERGWNPNNPLTVFKTSLPEGTPVPTIVMALPGLKERGVEYIPPSPLFLGSIIIIGILILIISIVLWRRIPSIMPSESTEVTKK